MEETININVSLGGIAIPLKVNVSDEANIRKIVKALDEQLTIYSRKYTGQSLQTLLSMLLIEQAITLSKLQQEHLFVEEELGGRLEQILSLFDTEV
ncbi:MAG TPA: cell division protein ZapA [Bacteroidales bacterium]|jgi:hypothetical protein|nr:cell division protein ZapA [Bacteroidales bacterium]MDI3479292.1 hypothetical protein [Rikenellaceae bacterium]MDI3544813.1 hypothetical protein [Rikenellaceae bacterium]MDN5355521.1 hypothetical protein [Rikenellaceae bacterium]HOB27557.1 cell division protein ZapA [Bacteroidales bacterium]